jgi:hypothetical protein
MHWLVRLTLILAALGFLGFGAWFLLDPVDPMARIGVTISGEAAPVELRAFYGGLEIALAAWLLLAATRHHWSRPGLWLVLLLNLGIGISRVIGALIDQVWTGFFTGALVWEFGFVALAAAALWVDAVQRTRDG